ncbi:MAG: hypothetical protein HY916_11375 [Desulfovibrio sp.]|nr:hypothetical protein [Desulfovibrio sp.]
MPKTRRTPEPLPQRVAIEQRGGWREAFEAYGTALSMAEAGEGDLARQILGEFHAEHRKILVLAQAGGVPQALAEYSVSLAERLGFDLVLLSVHEPARNAAAFHAAAHRGAESLFAYAARHGVACAHIVRAGRRDEALNAVSMELRRVEFVITDRLESERRQAALLVPEFSFRC